MKTTENSATSTADAAVPDKTAPIIDDDDAPFTRAEKIKFFNIILVIPWIIYVPFLYFGAFLYTYPDLPPIFAGLWWTPLTFNITYLASFASMLDHPRIMRERFRTSEFTGGTKPNEPIKEHITQRLLAAFMVLPLPLAGYESCVAADKQLMMMQSISSSSRNEITVFHKMGAGLTLSSILLILWVLRINKYAAKVVYRQPGQQLVTHGPYGFVRHPFYSFMIPLAVGWPWIMTGTAYSIALISSLLTIPVLMWRTFHEEDFLVAEFGEAYKRYRHDVPYRMIPMIF